jgi:hypothetical protein
MKDEEVKLEEIETFLSYFLCKILIDPDML